MKRKNQTCYKDPKTGKWKINPEYNRRKGREWRRKWYALGYTYKRLGRHWGWVKKKPRPVRARIHSNNPKEIAMVKRKIIEAGRK